MTEIYKQKLLIWSRDFICLEGRDSTEFKERKDILKHYSKVIVEEKRAYVKATIPALKISDIRGNAFVLITQFLMDNSCSLNLQFLFCWLVDRYFLNKIFVNGAFCNWSSRLISYIMRNSFHISRASPKWCDGVCLNRLIIFLISRLLAWKATPFPSIAIFQLTTVKLLSSYVIKLVYDSYWNQVTARNSTKMEKNYLFGCSLWNISGFT